MKLALDMDGVLVDIVAGFGKVFPIPDPYPNTYSVSEAFQKHETELWAITDRKWWADLPPTPEFDRLIYYAMQYFGPKQTFICSTPHENPESAAGKMDWLKTYLPDMLDRKAYHFTGQKWRVAKPDVILLDDHEENVKDFESNGGKVILFPQPWNRNYAIVNKVDYVLREFDRIRRLKG